MAKKSETKGERAVVITTEHRGVFFGYTAASDSELGSAEAIKLTRARLCVRWSSDVRGFMGLAGAGPSRGCRVGPATPAITLRKITAVMEASPEAVKAWESQPWS